jgi:hypothetical protein
MPNPRRAATPTAKKPQSPFAHAAAVGSSLLPSGLLTVVYIACPHSGVRGWMCSHKDHDLFGTFDGP